MIGRFGNLLKEETYGFDLLGVALQRNAAGVYKAHMEKFLAPLARPLDLLQVGRNLYILEYTRPIDRSSSRPMNPGRILELSW